jgi:hypothetical protein
MKKPFALCAALLLPACAAHAKTPGQVSAVSTAPVFVPVSENYLKRMPSQPITAIIHMNTGTRAQGAVSVNNLKGLRACVTAITQTEGSERSGSCIAGNGTTVLKVTLGKLSVPSTNNPPSPR